MPTIKRMSAPRELTTAISLLPTFHAWSHQKKMADWAYNHDKAWWIAGCGTGKTKAALMAIEKIQPLLTLVITMPKPLKSVWPVQIPQTLFGPRTLYLIKGTSKVKTTQMINFAAECERDGVPGIVVVNYETARLMPLDAVRWNLVICDESHKIASHNSAQSNDLARMLKNVPRKIIMTATPFSDRPLMAYGQVRFLSPAFARNGRIISADFGTWTEFYQKYALYYTKDDIPIITGYKNLDELSSIIAPYVVEVRKDEVLDLPPRFEIVRPVELSKEHRKVYDELRDDMITYVDGNMVLAQNVLVLSTRLHQLTSGYYKPFRGQDVQPVTDGDAKIKDLEELLEEIGDEPVVIFTAFDPDVRRIQGLLHKMGLTHQELTGSKDAHEAWQAGDGQILVANLQAGGTGIELTRARYVVYYSMGHSRTIFEQSLDRVHRPGQDRTVFIYYILAQDTIDMDIFDTLKDKGDVSEGLKERLRSG